jgi:signal transduction histidine kinase/signal transduction protein with GAF and PtsI domain
MPVPLKKANLKYVLPILNSTGFVLLCLGGVLIFLFLNPQIDPLSSGLFTLFWMFLLFIPFRYLDKNIRKQLRMEKPYVPITASKVSAPFSSAEQVQEVLEIFSQILLFQFDPKIFHVFLYDHENEQYLPQISAERKVTTDLRFASSSGVINILLNTTQPVFIEEKQFQELSSVEKEQMRLLGVDILIPFHGKFGLLGWAAIGPRKNRIPFTSEDREIIAAISSQAAVALERSLSLAKIESQEKEMKALMTIAQGMSSTIALDDIFELVYAQTTQIIPADDFHIILVEEDGSTFSHVFFVQSSERLPEREGENVLLDFDLELETFVSRKSSNLENYTRECEHRGITPSAPLFSWLGVPLNNGDDTIGVLSIGTRSSAFSYSRDDVTLLQTIGNQMAGSIVKARLLQISQSREQQLSSLNEVTRQLTSTLDQELLLGNILHSAVEILHAEAGHLLLFNEETQGLEFKVTVGPDAERLLNKQMPSDFGAIGNAFVTREPVMINAISSMIDLYPAPVSRNGLNPVSIIAVPMIVKESALGVLEVVNKTDGVNFKESDKELLISFASQAAVSLENARLYASTDKALAERVEELSVLQRIDRELNTSLDTKRSMAITLSWAMRQSNAQAGLIGMVIESGIQIIASEGFKEDIINFQDNVIPGELFNLQQSIVKGTTCQFFLNAKERRLLPDASNRLLLPIVRESKTIGMILLESTSTDPIPEETLDFLSRLCDHASVAIANAQLYTEVQAANIAKSDFVSFLAHELKNPMTSIKGYTDLIAAKAVGPITDPQANFLNVIRNNIDRMNTLISDLNDHSKIEAGRMRFEYKSLQLSEVMDEVLRSAKSQIENKNQQLHVDIPADLPNLWVDKIRLFQVLLNLVSNANKYTDIDGEVIVKAEVSPNQWDLKGAPTVVHILVKDSGIGISPEDQKKIFQKFFRSDDPKTREAPGTGLGLNITRSLVELQGGKIWFESEFRKGTTFHFTVPISDQ